MSLHHALPPEPLVTLQAYTDSGGMAGLERALRAGTDETIEAVTSAGIRGRGGAGFPTGRKWRSLVESIGPDDAGYVVINAAEGEPGTFKDRSLLRRNPFLVLEGALIAAQTLGVPRVVLATKARYQRELATVRAAIGELDDSGWSGGIDIQVVEGPDHYLFGEETAMLEVIEGEDPLPRHLAPYHYGLFTTTPQLGWSAGQDRSPGGPTGESANPALVNNVETYAHVALVLRHGADWYRTMGTKESPGPTIVTITGDVNTSIVAEVALGTSLREVIDVLAGGVTDAQMPKAVLSGVSNPVLLGENLDTPITYEHLRDAGGGLGSAGFIVYDNSRNMIDVAYQVLRFLHIESCGQCNPCKTGTADIAAELEHLVYQNSTSTDALNTIARRLHTVTDASRCYLPTQAQTLLTSIFNRFPEDLSARIDNPGDPDVVLPKLIDIEDGVAHVDTEHHKKRPDWTYAETAVRLRPLG